MQRLEKKFFLILLCYRVLYEVFPMSFLVEQAGGQSFTGKQRVFVYKKLLLLETNRKP